MTATATAEAPKQPLFDPAQQARMNVLRNERRDVIFAAIQRCHDIAAQKAIHPGYIPRIKQQDIAALVPSEHACGVVDALGHCINEGYLAFVVDPISKAALADLFCVTDKGSGVFSAGYAKASAKLVSAAKDSSPAKTSSSPAKP